MTTPNESLSYKDAGVDVEAADAFVDNIGDIVEATHSAVEVLKNTAYAGLVKPDLTGMNQPVLAATCDGVGTKLIVARDLGKYEGLGQDLVAMNVNDLLPAAAKPLLFLDYIATGKLDEGQLVEIVRGVANACRASGCALVGGETAEMPDVYQPGDFDLAGFAVGMVDQERIPNPAEMKAGDIVLGLASAGVHSNGLSLARKALFDRGGMKPTDTSEALSQSVGAELLVPTELYVEPMMDFLKHHRFVAAAHITGGGLLGRGLKLVQNGLGMRIDPNSYTRPAIFDVIQSAGGVSDDDMARTFNMGLGFLVVVEAELSKQLHPSLKERFQVVGEITDTFEGVDLEYARA